MEWLTVEFYRSLLSDVANYVMTDSEIEHSVYLVRINEVSAHEMIQCDECFALAVL